MSNLFGMIWTGVSGLNAAQTGISVTGNNMANMKTENYSRQTVELVTKKPQYTYNGAIGKGVDVAAIRREYDDLLAKNVRNSNSNYLYYNSMSSTLKSAMLYFNELESGSGLGDALKDYFNAWQDLSNSAPDDTSESLTKRTVLVEAADTLAIKIRDGYQYLEDARNQCDITIQNEVNAINEITIAQSLIHAPEDSGLTGAENHIPRHGSLRIIDKCIIFFQRLRRIGLLVRINLLAFRNGLFEQGLDAAVALHDADQFLRRFVVIVMVCLVAILA